MIASSLPAFHAGKPPAPKVGVLLVNLGTPDDLRVSSVRRYLREFLSDPRVVELPRPLWWLILHLFVLPFRPAKTAAAYAKIWDKAHNDSPLRVITAAQAEKLQEALGKGILVRYAMRYGHPALRDVLDDMAAAGCVRIVVAPLYPQYSAATVGTVGDEVAKWLLGKRFQPAISFLPPYYGDEVYIGALADSVKNYEKSLGWKPDVVVASLHGMPLAYCQKGDPYYCHSHKTVRLLAEALKRPFCKTFEDTLAAPKGKAPVLLAFQSRFGKAEWLKPYTADTLAELARCGLKNVLVVCPGFSADCVETLEEIAIGGAEIFHEAGGRNFAFVPCLNDSDKGMLMLEALVRKELGQ